MDRLNSFVNDGAIYNYTGSCICADMISRPVALDVSIIIERNLFVQCCRIASHYHHLLKHRHQNMFLKVVVGKDFNI